MIDLSVFEALLSKDHEIKKMNDIFSYKNKLFIDITFLPIFVNAKFVKDRANKEIIKKLK